MFLTATVTSTDQATVIAQGAVQTGGQVSGWLAGVNWASPSWDLFIAVFFLVAVFLYGLSLGRERIIVILVAIYMSLAVVTNAPYIGQLRGGMDQFAALRIALFISIFVALFFLLSRSAMLKALTNLTGGGFLQVLFFSALQVGLIVSVAVSFLPSEGVAALAPLTKTVFASDMGRFFWIVSPILCMTMLKGNEPPTP